MLLVIIALLFGTPSPPVDRRLSQGWARDVKAPDWDAHLPRPRRWLRQTKRDVKISRRDRDETFV